MNEAPNQNSSSLKREAWLSHVETCEKSDVSHAAYCRSVGISYSSFKYWRGILLSENTNKNKEKFVAVKIEKPSPSHSESSPRSIQVKLVSGHVVYIPTTLPIADIAQLIRSVENAHA